LRGGRGLPEAKALTSLDAGKTSGDPGFQEPRWWRRSPVETQSTRRTPRVLASLPRKQRRYLALKVASHSCREICALTGASYTNVNKHLGSARARNPNGYVDGCGQAVATTGFVTVCLPPARPPEVSFFFAHLPVVAPRDRFTVTEGEVSRTPKSGIPSRRIR